LLVGKQLVSAYVSESETLADVRDGSAPLPEAGPAGDEPRAGRTLIFAIVSIGLFMASVDQTIVATALPAIQHELHTQINWSGWTITIYALGQVVAMPLAGKISDMYGRKKVFLISAILFTASSLCCGFAGNIWLLLLPRFTQALGGGAFMPSATGIVSDHYGRERDRAVGMFTSILPIGGIIGPIIGGVFVSYWSWRGIFLVNVPIGILLITLVARFIPANSVRVTRRIDVPGVVLLAGAILAGMFGITYLGTGDVPWYSPVFLGCEAVAAVSAWLFVRHARTFAAPFVPYRLLRGRGFGVMNLINLIYGAAALGFAALVPLYGQERYGIAPLGAGTLLTARAVGMISVAGLAVLALRRTGYRLPMIGGFLILAGGLFAMSVAAPLSPYAWLALAAGVTGCGMGLSVPAANNASLQLAPDQVAAIAGLRGMFRQAGSIVAVSVTTAIIARSQHPGTMQAEVFVVFACLLVALIPVVWWLVPDHRGNW
jgi:EmrB/QacA subfamily drug resistance transporter